MSMTKPKTSGGYVTWDISKYEKYLMEVEYVYNGVTNGIYYFAKTVPVHIGSVYSWRGKRPPRDKYGWLPVNDFHLDQFKCNYYPMSWNTRYATSKQVYNISGYPHVYLNSALRLSKQTVTLSMREQAERCLAQSVQEAYEKANGPDLPGAVWIAEAGESVMELRKIAFEARRLIEQYRNKRKALKKRLKKQGADPRSYADAVSSLWLQYRYGLLPLMLTAEDLVEFLVEKRKEKKIVSDSVSMAETLSTTKHTFQSYGRVFEFQKKLSIAVKGNVSLYPSAIRNPVSERDLGFKGHDLLSATWELINLSFVIDWFLNVGTWIGSWRPGGAEIAHQSNTWTVDLVEEIELKRSTPLPNWVGSCEAPVNSMGVTTIKLRTPEVWRPFLPTFNMKALIVERKLDAVALIYKALARRLK